MQEDFGPERSHIGNALYVFPGKILGGGFQGEFLGNYSRGCGIINSLTLPPAPLYFLHPSSADSSLSIYIVGIAGLNTGGGTTEQGFITR